MHVNEKIDRAFDTLEKIRMRVRTRYEKTNLSNEQILTCSDEFFEREVDRAVQIYCAHESGRSFVE